MEGVSMSYGMMNGFADIIEIKTTKDSEGFSTTVDEVLASVRVYREGRHGSQRWANLAAFSEATDLFRFRCIPGLTITTDHVLVCDGGRYDITSVENVKGRGMYVEVLAKRSEATNGKS
jgi:phage head-tail adaptor, putative